MTAAEEAYGQAEEAIALAKAEGATVLRFDTAPFRALETLPPSIAELTGLQHLTLANTQIVEISRIAGLLTLRRLTLVNTYVVDISPLAGLQNLQILYFSNTRVADILPLASLQNLQALRLENTYVTDISSLAGLQNLRELYLANTLINDISHLAGLQHLKALDLAGTEVADISVISQLTNLEFLDLLGTAVSDVSSLEGLQVLRSLSLGVTPVNDFTPLEKLSELRKLSLASTQISDISNLAQLQNLNALTLSETDVTDISALEGLQSLRALDLDLTKVTDLSHLARLQTLQQLHLNDTEVADISPLANLQSLQTLALSNSQVADLRPVLACPDLINDKRGGGLHFRDTPATRVDTRLAELSEIADNRERTEKTFAYLRTLPEWPAPLPAQSDAKRDDSKSPQAENAFPLTVTALLDAQDSAGWRFSPDHGAMVLYVDDAPADARQSKLSELAGQRVKDLLAQPGLHSNVGGLREDVRSEAQRFADILADGSRDLSEKSLDLWASTIALGSHLDANDVGRVQGRDPLDLLSVEARSALQTFLAVAGNLVRSFPDIREMDDGHANFSGRTVTAEMILAVVDAALRKHFVNADSVALIQHVARLSEDEGRQAEKARSTTQRGGMNLVRSAAMVGYGALAGISAGVTADVGQDISDHYELGEKAIEFLDSGAEEIEKLLNALPPDEAARLRSQIEDALGRREGPR